MTVSDIEDLMRKIHNPNLIKQHIDINADFPTLHKYEMILLNSLMRILNHQLKNINFIWINSIKNIDLKGDKAIKFDYNCERSFT